MQLLGIIQSGSLPEFTFGLWLVIELRFVSLLPPPSLMTFFPPLSDLFPHKKPFSKTEDMKTLTLSLKTIF